MINPHQLELYYYVARYGGITEAVKKMPYGIQQPALSKQILDLEQYLGGPLFHRRPFCLTLSGQKLYDYVQPFFENQDRVIEDLRAGTPELVRLATSPIVLRDYLPPILRLLRQQFPQLRLTLREGPPDQIRYWLDAQEIDLAVAVGKSPAPPGCQAQTLVRLPLALLVSTRSRIRSAVELWAQDPIREPLISPGEEDALTRLFRTGLARRGVEWTTTMEMTSFGAIESYAADGFGVGLSVLIPGRKSSRRVRVLPLDGFPPLEVRLSWRRHPNPAATAILSALQEKARLMREALKQGGS